MMKGNSINFSIEVINKSVKIQLFISVQGRISSNRAPQAGLFPKETSVRDIRRTLRRFVVRHITDDGGLLQSGSNGTTSVVPESHLFAIE
jgi:hypothetical protein